MSPVIARERGSMLVVNKKRRWDRVSPFRSSLTGFLKASTVVFEVFVADGAKVVFEAALSIESLLVVKNAVNGSF